MSEPLKEHKISTDPKEEKAQELKAPSDLLNDQIKLDLSDFLIAKEQFSEEEKNKFYQELSQYDKEGDLYSIQTANLKHEQVLKNPNLRQAKLSAIFLEQLSGSKYKLDFKNLDYISLNLNLTDLLPPQVKAVDIYDEEGNLLFKNATREIHEGEQNFYAASKEDPNKKEEIFLRSGFQIEMTKTNPKLTEIQKLQEEMEVEKLFQKQLLKTETKKVAEFQDRELDPINKPQQKIYEDIRRQVTPTSWKDLFNGNSEALKPLITLILTLISSLTSIFPKQNSQKTNLDTNQPSTSSPEFSKENIIKIARSHVNSTAFRGPEVAGGSVACALVASTIRKQSGALDSVEYSVDGAERALLRKGWKRHSSPGLPGDVVIWGPTPSSVKDGITVKGHRHIGIMLEDGKVIDNNSKLKTPIESTLNYNNPRGLSFLSPP